ncbi:MAG: translation elongation factor Ts [Myxococcales bacterium]|jgi:elongation factor Ts|nr:translation elongation factor Ts [Myxococcales bacterium]
MTDITPARIKELRERTQAGMSDCKTALVEAGGDIDKAVEIILKKGIVKAASRAGKVATEGEVRTWVSADKKKGVIVEVNCQTDFVARGDDFRGFVTKVTEVAVASKKGEELGGKTYPGTSDTIDTVRQQMVAKTGENTVIRRWDALDASSDGCIVHAYVHMGGKLAVLIEAAAPSADASKNADFTAFVENCAMQIAAMSPIVVKKEEITESEIAKQKEIFQAQLKEEGKPEQAWPKIIEGKVAKWFTEVTLLGQDNVWAPGEGSIDKLRQELGKKLGGEVLIHKFLRFGLGEGIEKKTDDLAAEVAKMTAG